MIGGRRQAADAPNVIVSGWQIYDNKGRAVEVYEPFFSAGLDYEPARDAQLGRKATMFYDPRGEVIRTLAPDGSEQRVIHGIPDDLSHPEQFTPTPWEAYSYDANDLAAVSHGPDGAPLAAAAPATHHFTPSSIVIDALGRTVLAIARSRARLRTTPAGPLPPIEELRTATTYDIRGNVLTVTDPLNRVAFSYRLRSGRSSVADREPRCGRPPHRAEHGGRRSRAARQQGSADPPGLRSSAAAQPRVGAR